MIYHSGMPLMEEVEKLANNLLVLGNQRTDS